MFKIRDIVEASFYADDNMDDKNLIKKNVIVIDIIEHKIKNKTFRCFLADEDSSELVHIVYIDKDKEFYPSYYKKIGELTKEDFDVRFNQFLERINKWEMERAQKFYDTEKEIEWNEDHLKYPFLYESSVNAQSHNSYFSEAVGIVTLKGDVFPYVRRFWTSEPLNENSPKVIPESIEAGKPSKMFV